MQPPKIFALYHNIQPVEYIMETDLCTIGRASTCHIVVRHTFVSRLHAKIERDGPNYVLYDNNSANGTFVNGQQICGSQVLEDQDLIGLSSELALLRFEDPAQQATVLCGCVMTSRVRNLIRSKQI